MILHNNFDNLSIIEKASEAGANKFTFILEAQNGSLPKVYSKSLKENIRQKITTAKYIDDMFISRQEKILLKAQNGHTAKELCYIEAIMGIPIRIQYITSRFFLHNTEKTADLLDLRELEEENNIKI
ncbi:hypothetical protein HNY73_021922 [Argiope bruennichi]|uniref:Uncharacterized protein n=1 Tax=Argiope bruennichi TaxID=94029 RepID=A0A8T0E2W2_ARGBR|nr:hypothetical protein HNY73_021922 [Argiope bruennichi]